MSEWISIEEAAGKYSIKKEYIQLWVDMQVIISYFKDGGMVVSDESLRGFLRIREQGISPDYLKILEQFCIGRSETCLTYVYLLGARDKEIEMYRDAKLQRDTLRGMWMEQNERMRDLELELELEQGNCYKCRLKKLCMGLKRLKLNRLIKTIKTKKTKMIKL